MSNPTPTQLPEFIFLLSDHTTRALACDVAKALDRHKAASWDFLMPIHEAAQALASNVTFDDWGDPRAVTPEQQDLINSLEKWHGEHFGAEHLGQIAYNESCEHLSNESIVFRDATWSHIKPFLASLKPHQYLIVDFANSVVLEAITPEVVSRKVIMTTEPLTVDSVVNAILEASK